MADGKSLFSSIRSKASALVRKPTAPVDGEKLSPTLDHYLTSQAISGAIMERRPFLASRLGWLESFCIGSYLKTGEATDAILQKIWLHAGVFPATPEQFGAFTSTYLAALEQADLLGLMNAPFESSLIKRHCPTAFLTELGALEPYFSAFPWSRHLKDLDVLVIHPFSDSIESQFHTHREVLFANPNVLPSFHLKTLRPPQTLGSNTGEHGSWSESLYVLKSNIAAVSFDVAIVGCGAYGLPAGAFIKSLGKPCIHLGGATQILFGVTGARWREQPAFRALQTKAWRAPLESERPKNWQKIENGCYW